MSFDEQLLDDISKLRDAIGDHGVAELRTDDYIQSQIDQNGYTLAVALVAESLASEFAQEPGSVTLPSGLSVSWAARVAEWNLRASQYRAMAAQESAAGALNTIPVSASVRHVVTW